MSRDLTSYRDEFPALAHFNHLALAHKAPLPRCARDVMESFLDDAYSNAGDRSFSMERVEEARTVLARLLGVPQETLAFVRNTSEGIGIAAAGLDLTAGDRVLVSELEHEANLLPWRRLESRGVRVDTLPGSHEELIAGLTDETRVVAVSWVTYGTGTRFDLGALGRACRERGVLLVADGIQGVGVLNVPISELNVDLLACGGHKGLLGLAGAGFVYCRQELAARLEPPQAAKFSFASMDKWARPLELAPDARRFEYGNPNYLGIAVLERSAKLLMEIGPDRIEERVRTLSTRLIERAQAAGIEIATPIPWTKRAGIVSLNVSEPERVRMALRDQRILVSVKDDRYLRLATHFYNTEAEIDQAVEAIAACR